MLTMSHISYLITQILQDSPDSLLFVRLLEAAKVRMSVEWNETSSKYIKWLPSVARPESWQATLGTGRQTRRETRTGSVSACSVGQPVCHSIGGIFNQIAVNEREGREQWEHLQPSHQTVRVRLSVLYLLITGTNISIASQYLLLLV